VSTLPGAATLAWRCASGSYGGCVTLPQAAPDDGPLHPHHRPPEAEGSHDLRTPLAALLRSATATVAASGCSKYSCRHRGMVAHRVAARGTGTAGAECARSASSNPRLIDDGARESVRLLISTRTDNARPPSGDYGFPEIAFASRAWGVARSPPSARAALCLKNFLVRRPFFHPSSASCVRFSCHFTSLIQQFDHLTPGLSSGLGQIRLPLVSVI